MTNPAQLTGHGSFTFKLGGQTFRGAAVPLAQYFAWTAVQGQPGSEEHASFLAQALAERHKPGRVPCPIDTEWVMQHVRVQHIAALEGVLLEEIDPGDAFERDTRLLTVGRVKFQAASYTLAEHAAHQALFEAQGEGQGEQRRLPADVRFDEVARALRVRHRAGLSDPALITVDWVIEHLTLPALAALDRLLHTGYLPGEDRAAEGGPSKP